MKRPQAPDLALDAFLKREEEVTLPAIPALVPAESPIPPLLKDRAAAIDDFEAGWAGFGGGAGVGNRGHNRFVAEDVAQGILPRHEGPASACADPVCVAREQGRHALAAEPAPAIVQLPLLELGPTPPPPVVAVERVEAQAWTAQRRRTAITTIGTLASDEQLEAWESALTEKGGPR